MMTVVLTAFTLIAFAGNSLLCRMALGSHHIDPVSFTAIRLASGAAALIPISRLFGESASGESRASWISGLALFAYAFAFSLAYVSLTTGTGALLLFGAVQVTMIGAALKSGERLRRRHWIGLGVAVAGLIYLLLPGISAPNPLGAFMMCVAGMAWGIYSLRGKDAQAPARMTAGNFLRSAPMALAAVLATVLVAAQSIRLEPIGVALALVSGVLTSGLGYVLWYRVLRVSTTTQASIVQLLAPVLAAFGGITFLSESLSFRLLAASVMVLGGVSVAVRRR
ncbi:MAG TPA: DMT family transporter [Terriglobia bacterium]|nr:DMT family transporter [Terriglobia bacterium]